MGLEAKTDRVDAQVIARYGAVAARRDTGARPGSRGAGRDPGLPPPVIDEITVRRQQLEHLQSPRHARAGHARPAGLLRQEAKELAKLLRQTIQADEALAADFDLLTSMPGCGPILAATLLAELPELGRARPPQGRRARRPRPGRQGQRPAREPTRHQGRPLPDPPRPRHGSRRLAAHQGQPVQSPLRPAQRRGKAPKLALTALMRKMLVTLNAMLKTRQAWKSPT